MTPAWGKRLLALVAMLAVFSPAVPYAAAAPAAGPLRPGAYELFASSDGPALLAVRITHGTPATAQPAVDSLDAHATLLTGCTWCGGTAPRHTTNVGSRFTASAGPRAPPAPGLAHEAGASTH